MTSLRQIHSTKGLLPCPFCGSEPQFIAAEEDKGLAALIHCVCSDCAATPSVAAHNDKLVVSFWNHRSR